MKAKKLKNKEIYPTLLKFIQSFDLYRKTKSFKQLSDRDIEIFARMYYTE